MTYARQPSQAERIELQRMTRQAVGRVSQRAQQWVIAKAVSEAGPEVAILYGEESRVQLLPLIRAMWHWVGQQLRIPTPSTNVTRALFGALNIRTERWVYLVRKRMRTDDFLAFLEHLLVVYPDGPILLIVDNFSSHTAQAVSTWLATHARLHLYYSPKYCSHVNPVERIWLQLKNRLTANRLYGSLPLLLTIVEAVFTLTALGLILPGEWRRPTSLLQDEDPHG